MRFQLTLSLAILPALLSPALASDLQWQSHRQANETEAASASATRQAARFQRAQRPTPEEPAQFQRNQAAPLRQVSHTTAKAPIAAKRPRRTPRVAQSRGSEATQAPLPSPPSVPVAQSNPFDEYESQPPMLSSPGGEMYSGQAYGGQTYGGECCGPECYGPECGCGCPEPDCGFMAPGCGCNDVGCAGDCCGDMVGCGDPCGGLGSFVDRGAIPIHLYLLPINHLTLYSGVQAFKGPLDEFRGSGNFGLHAGVELGGRMSWLPWPGLGYQFGYQATGSQFPGGTTGIHSDAHSQHFMTTGLFRRRCVGFSYGLVYDMLSDERVESAKFHQARGLLSFTNIRGHEVGFMFTSSDDRLELNGGTAAAPNLMLFEPVERYVGFWRYHACHGGEFRLYGGGGNGFGVFGGDIAAPLNNKLELKTGFSYFSPDGSGVQAAEDEGWNLGINLVWHLGHNAKRSFKSPWRPMFDMADNGSFFVDDVD